MRKSQPVQNLTLQQILNMRLSETDLQGVLYEDNCIVGHNMRAKESPSDKTILQSPTRMDITFVILCLEGHTTVQCDMQEIRIGPGTLFLCKPGSILQAKQGKTEVFSLLMTNEHFNEQLNISFKKLLPHYASLEKLIALQLNEKQCDRLNTMFGLVAETIASDHTQMYYHEIVRAYIKALAYEIVNDFAQHLQAITTDSSPNSANRRDEEVFRQFVGLLGQHFREEHGVQFYANRLNISAKYLNFLIKRLTGRTSSKWIEEYIMSEARVLLQNTDLNVQQVSDTLHFATQAIFGKYFKAHMGISPSAYRAEQNK